MAIIFIVVLFNVGFAQSNDDRAREIRFQHEQDSIRNAFSRDSSLENDDEDALSDYPITDAPSNKPDIAQLSTYGGNAQDYYPLKVGNVWEYSLGKTGSIKIRMFIESYNKFTDEYTHVHVFKAASITKITKSILDVRKNAIIRVAYFNDATSEWIESGIIELKLPLIVGTKWETNTNMKRIYEVIKKSTETLNGVTYNDVMVVKRTLYGGKEKSYWLEYYAPNIGLLKITDLSGKELVQWLSSFETTD